MGPYRSESADTRSVGVDILQTREGTPLDARLYSGSIVADPECPLDDRHMARYALRGEAVSVQDVVGCAVSVGHMGPGTIAGEDLGGEHVAGGGVPV